MNIKRVYKEVLEECSREYYLPQVEKLVNDKDNKAILTGEITKTQWNGLLSFCMRTENIANMIYYIQEKMERKESPWGKRVKKEGKESTIGEYIIKHLREIKECRLADPLDKTKNRINKTFPEEDLENILTDEEKKEIVLLQAREFIRTLVKNVLFTPFNDGKMERDL
jgi:3-methyladenine DNA glycosylase AlkC